MMTKPNDGGPAFPNKGDNTQGPHSHNYDGMTLRQWYAGQALASVTSEDLNRWPSAAHIAEWCRSVADALIAELKK